jgi:WD40 repeat protein
MKPLCLTLLAVALAVMVFAPLAPAADNDAKVVRLIWFPRFSPDGTLVLSAHGHWSQNEGGEARLLATKDGAVQYVFKHPRGVRTVAWSPKGTFIVTGGYGEGIRGFDVKSQKELFQLAGDKSIENLRITSDDKLLVASFGSGDLRLYDLPSRKEVHHFEAVHDGGIWGMAVSPNDSLVASGGKDNYAIVHDLGTHKKLHSLKHPGEVNGLVFTPDSRFLVTGCTDARIRVFDMSTGERMAMVKAHDGGTIPDFSFTSDGKLLASAGTDGTIRLWDTTDLKNPTQTKMLRASTQQAFGVAISPDDRWLVSAGWDDKLKMWDLATGEVVWTWKRE